MVSCLAFVSKVQHKEKGRPPSVCEREGIPTCEGKGAVSGEKGKEKGTRQTKVARAPAARGPPLTFLTGAISKNEKEIKTNQEKKMKKSSGRVWNDEAMSRHAPGPGGKGARLRAR